MRIIERKVEKIAQRNLYFIRCLFILQLSCFTFGAELNYPKDFAHC